MRNILIETYLDYVNNYLTIEKWAEHNGLSYDHGKSLLRLAEHVFNSDHPEA